MLIILLSFLFVYIIRGALPGLITFEVNFHLPLALYSSAVTVPMHTGHFIPSAPMYSSLPPSDICQPSACSFWRNTNGEDTKPGTAQPRPQAHSTVVHIWVWFVMLVMGRFLL
jgi:hypothetical protein